MDATRFPSSRQRIREDPGRETDGSDQTAAEGISEIGKS